MWLEYFRAVITTAWERVVYRWFGSNSAVYATTSVSFATDHFSHWRVVLDGSFQPPVSRSRRIISATGDSLSTVLPTTSESFSTVHSSHRRVAPGGSFQPQGSTLGG
ncbi:hypothetical protein LSAT2_030127 [Lamellibrachia satsuma]|nr:hypothetical protein LSAT2_030127 [Lamellibrachia satsuma]